MSPRNRLAAIFSPTRRLADTEQSLVRRGGALGGVQWVVPRAECHYRRIEFPALAARQRMAAARIAARRHEPSPAALFHVAWVGSAAHVWTWPAPTLETGADEGDWIPESLLRPPVQGDGLRLLRLVDGYEGQYWLDGGLRASQWWPRPPDDAGWRRFARSCGLAPSLVPPVPEPEAAPWGEPWGDRARSYRGSPARLERWGWAAVAAIVLAGLGWQLAADLAWSRARTRMDARMASLRAEAAPLLAARERADTARAALQDLIALQGSIDDYRLMAEVVAPLPGARLLEWSRDGSTLELVVQSPDTDPRHFVAAYDGHPRLADVVATPLDSGSMGLRFTLPAPRGDDDDAEAAP